MAEESAKNIVEQQQMSSFIQFTKLIQSIIQNLGLLFQSGYPHDYKNFAEIEFICKDSKF